MSKKINRVTLPAKIIEQLYNDEEFFREVSSVKKLSLSRFPKNDQWVSEEGFNMVFALAGYGSEDLNVSVHGSKLTISSKNHIQMPKEDEPQKTISHGVVNRGIARRNFKISFIINEEYDITKTFATMEKGLLHITIPTQAEMFHKEITIKGD